VYECKYVDKKLSEIVLHPIEMGYDYTGDKPRVTRQIGHTHKYLDGSPRLASGANGQKILEMIQKICADRGTIMAIKNGVGIIAVPA